MQIHERKTNNQSMNKGHVALRNSAQNPLAVLAGNQSLGAVIQRLDLTKEADHLESAASKWYWAKFWRSDNEKRRDDVMQKILAEASVLLSSAYVELVDDASSELKPEGVKVEDRTYTVRINQDLPFGEAYSGFRPTENRLRSIILHELIHVAADQTYAYNKTTDKNIRSYNVDRNSERMDPVNDRLIYTRIRAIIDGVAHDNAIPDDQKAYIVFRLERAIEWDRELDTVMSELVYYFHLQGISANSTTSLAITNFAEERYNLRSREEGPIAKKSRMISEKVQKDLWNQAIIATGGPASMYRE